MLKQFNLSMDDYHSFILVEVDRHYQKSAAALRIAKGINGIWPIHYALIVVPRPIRDFIYDVLAKNRYK